MLAAEQGDAHAQNDLGLMYQFGKYVGQDSLKACEYFKQAADQDLPMAMENLADMYRSDEGVKDLAKAMQWYKKAADAGDTSSLLKLGDHYLAGWGVEANECAGTPILLAGCGWWRIARPLEAWQDL